MINDPVAQKVYLSTQDQETVALGLHTMEVEILLGANSKAPEEGTNLIKLGNKTHGVIHVAGDWMIERLIKKKMKWAAMKPLTFIQQLEGRRRLAHSRVWHPCDRKLTKKIQRMIAENNETSIHAMMDAMNESFTLLNWRVQGKYITVTGQNRLEEFMDMEERGMISRIGVDILAPCGKVDQENISAERDNYIRTKWKDNKKARVINKTRSPRLEGNQTHRDYKYGDRIYTENDITNNSRDFLEHRYPTYIDFQGHGMRPNMFGEKNGAYYLFADRHTNNRELYMTAKGLCEKEQMISWSSQYTMKDSRLFVRIIYAKINEQGDWFSERWLRHVEGKLGRGVTFHAVLSLSLEEAQGIQLVMENVDEMSRQQWAWPEMRAEMKLLMQGNAPDDKILIIQGILETASTKTLYYFLSEYTGELVQVWERKETNGKRKTATIRFRRQGTAVMIHE